MNERSPRHDVRLEPEAVEALDRLRGEATRTRWVRGAIRAAAADPGVASAVQAAMPPDPRGGARAGAGGKRPGAGRPRTKRSGAEAEEEEK